MARKYFRPYSIASEIITLKQRLLNVKSRERATTAQPSARGYKSISATNTPIVFLTDITKLCNKPAMLSINRFTLIVLLIIHIVIVYCSHFRGAIFMVRPNPGGLANEVNCTCVSFSAIHIIYRYLLGAS